MSDITLERLDELTSLVDEGEPSDVGVDLVLTKDEHAYLLTALRDYKRLREARQAYNKYINDYFEEFFHL